MICRLVLAATFLALPAHPQQPQYPTLVLDGSVTRTAGSLRESGGVEFIAGKDGTWSETWTLNTRSFQHSSEDCKTLHSTDFECKRTVPWFAPWLADQMVSGDSVMQRTYISTGKAETSGQQTLLYSATPQSPKHSSAQTDVALSYRKAQVQYQITYDTNALPIRVDFADYLDLGMSQKIDTYVLFSDYREESGLMVPHHIERYVQRTLQSDIHITRVTTR